MLEPDKPQAERRRHPRMLMDATLNCICLDPDAVDVVNCLQTVDISRGGMGALSPRAFYPGERLILSVPLSPGSGRRNLYASIVRSRYDAETDGHRVGLAFDNGAVGASRGIDLTATCATCAA